MLISSYIAILGSAAALVLAASIITPSSATITSLGPGSPITSSVTNGNSVTFAPTPATEILEVTDPDFKNDFSPQDPSNVAAGIATVFDVPTPTLSFDDEGPIKDPYDPTLTADYNYVAIHNGQGELIFFYNTLQSRFDLAGFGANLSNARFYECAASQSNCNVVPAPLIGHGLPVLLALGGVLFGTQLWGRGQKRRSLGIAFPHAA